MEPRKGIMKRTSPLSASLEITSVVEPLFAETLFSSSEEMTPSTGVLSKSSD